MYGGDVPSGAPPPGLPPVMISSGAGQLPPPPVLPPSAYVTTAGTSDLMRRLEVINKLEEKIRELPRLAQNCFSELSKDKQIPKQKMEEYSSTYKKTLQQIENELNAQMTYLQNVCVGSAHQGSTYASLQTMTLADQATTALHSEVNRILTARFLNASSSEREAEKNATTVTPVVKTDVEMMESVDEKP